MEQDERMEMQLWAYVDGLCTDAEHARISDLILTDPDWKAAYDDVHAVQKALQDALELEQPSMRFSKNVMDQVARTGIAPATRKYIDPRIITGIAVFFVTLLSGTILYALLHTDWHAASGLGNLYRPLKKIDYSVLTRGNYVFPILAINVALALVLGDKMLRLRKHREDAHAH